MQSIFRFISHTTFLYQKLPPKCAHESRFWSTNLKSSGFLLTTITTINLTIILTSTSGMFPLASTSSFHDSHLGSIKGKIYSSILRTITSLLTISVETGECTETSWKYWMTSITHNIYQSVRTSLRVQGTKVMIFWLL